MDIVFRQDSICHVTSKDVLLISVQVNQARVDFFNANPVDSDTLDQMYTSLRVDFGFSTLQSLRAKAFYVAVIPTSNDSFTGLW